MRYLASALIPALVSVVGSARGDVLHATREQPLVELSHLVDIRIDDGVAIYKVRRQFQNPGKLADEAQIAIDLPYGAAATGLRIRARDTWFDGELMEREKAAALYHELTGLGAYAPKDPALLQWVWADKLHLQIFPVLPSRVSTVEYTLTAPTRYAGGRYFVSYPRVDAATSKGVDREGASRQLATPVVTVHPSWGDASTSVLLDGERISVDRAVALKAPVRPSWADSVAADPAASYVASSIEIPASSHTDKTFDKARIEIDIRHTYKSDLRVELVTPEGKVVKLHERSGGSENDVLMSKDIDLPAGTHAKGIWRLVVSDHAAFDSGTIDGFKLTVGDMTVKAADTPVFIPDAPENPGDAGVATISIAPPPIATLSARLGRVVASDQHAFSRLEIDVAPVLVAAPVRAQVVFVVDASFSVGAEMLAAELDLMRAYLTHVPDAEVEIIAYRRRAERVFGEFVPAARVEAALAAAKRRGAFALGNGSAIDEAARLSAAILADRPGPRRVVIETDELLRTSLTSGAALAALATLSPRTIVHVAVPEMDHDDRVGLSRDDRNAFAPLATKHHGIFARVQGFPVRAIKALAPTALELVRPTRLEDFAVEGIAVEPKVLHEGDGLRVMHLGKSAAVGVVLTGKLWSDPFRREVPASDLFSRQTAAFVFGANAYQPLSRPEQLRVAMRGRAVSPVTSYVAFEPGTRPSTLGLEEFGAGGLGLIGHGSGGGSGAGFGVGRSVPDLRSMVDVKACTVSVKPAPGWRAAFSVETTKDEIVDVRAKSGTNSTLTACLLEAVWVVRLDARFSLVRETFDFELTG